MTSNIKQGYDGLQWRSDAVAGSSESQSMEPGFESILRWCVDLNLLYEWVI